MKQNDNSTEKKFELRNLGVGEDFKDTFRFRHMMPVDSLIWRGFIRTHKERFEKVWYDVHVGRAMDVPEGGPQFLNKVAEAVSRKRIDVIGKRENELWIVEVKPVANMEALGQLLTYTRLFEEEFEIPGRLKAACVCFEKDPDLVDDYRSMGFSIFTVDTDKAIFR